MIRGFLNYQADGDLISATILNENCSRKYSEILVLVKDGKEFAVANYTDSSEELTDPEWFFDLTEAVACYTAKLTYYYE